MKAFIFLADYATGHPDGTLSATRAMINRLHVKRGAPPQMQVFLVARLSFDPADVGKHRVDIKCLDGSGADILRPNPRDFVVPAETRDANIVSRMVLKFPAIGAYSFVLECDSSPIASWDFVVAEAAEEGTE